MNYIWNKIRWDKRVRIILRPIAPAYLVVKNYALYFISKILKLNSEANIGNIEILKKAKGNDTIFILGCGYSINAITQEEWQHIADAGDTMSFNYFFKGRFIPIKYHLCGEIVEDWYEPVLGNKNKQEAIKAYYNETFSNPYYKDSIYFLRFKLGIAPIESAIWAVFFSKVFKNRNLCPYGIVLCTGKIREPSDSIHRISHHSATLSDAINISYILGYKVIVLVGVDLYDSRYFWLRENESEPALEKKGRQYYDRHATADRMVNVIDTWIKYLEEKGVSLFVYNPHSLLNKVLPIYRSQ